MSAVSCLATMEGGPIATTERESTNVECGAITIIGASLEFAFSPTTFK